MQTFLPYKNFTDSAKVLDWRRLGKQRGECKQIYLALTDANYGWKNHPAVKMWANNLGDLLYYACCICQEWRNRGYKDTLLDFFQAQRSVSVLPAYYITPEWITDQFCASHRSNLLRKKPEWYSQFKWTEPNNLEYIWPTQKSNSI